MPTSKFLLASFVVEHSGKRFSSCKNWMTGIKIWHEINGAGDDKFGKFQILP
ncbi:hypothetical protein M378DRAFT_168948 [Amanita muscaria Koide BX008]|uniref:Uncharacterized protein n=1 Tax=Amanita muscaria (strain Koide BX008) TaxID=946122 RepID=A0A0C2WE83_AMAMK|nr:hypothetical protein M378DRAFT_168948 [Amanita muscaria Koide BX008]